MSGTVWNTYGRIKRSGEVRSQVPVITHTVYHSHEVINKNKTV